MIVKLAYLTDNILLQRIYSRAFPAQALRAMFAMYTAVHKRTHTWKQA